MKNPGRAGVKKMTENQETAARPGASAALRTGLEAFIRRNFGPAAGLVTSDGFLRTSPAAGGLDGFFAALLVRRR